jgi:hypothetical protein
MHALSLCYLESCHMHSLIVSSQFSVIFVSEVLKLLINVVSQICSLIAWNSSARIMTITVSAFGRNLYNYTSDQ